MLSVCPGACLLKLQNHIAVLPMAETSFLTGKWKRMNITTMWSDAVCSKDKQRMHSVILTPYVYSVVYLMMLSVSRTVQCQIVRWAIHNERKMWNEATVADVNTGINNNVNQDSHSPKWDTKWPPSKHNKHHHLSQQLDFEHEICIYYNSMLTDVCRIWRKRKMHCLKQTFPRLWPFFLNLQRQLLHVSISDKVVGSEVSWQRLWVKLQGAQIRLQFGWQHLTRCVEVWHRLQKNTMSNSEWFWMRYYI